MKESRRKETNFAKFSWNQPFYHFVVAILTTTDANLLSASLHRQSEEVRKRSEKSQMYPQITLKHCLNRQPQAV
jgi:hypothetical protein